jgi:hypothetical protein
MADEPQRRTDLTDAYERAANMVVPRFMYPAVAAFFVLLCGVMAVMLFGVGSYFGGALFSLIVLVGFYVLWNNLRERLRRA